ncbi:hypothetical protein JXM83_05665 [Candidatus Woesearchaeota archaeon]|nr:hypothetical protein [Candidatus Woesearchaeota archaeon]
MLVLAVIIGGFVIIFGVKSLSSVGGQMSNTAFDDFLMQLNTNLIKYRSSYKEVQLLELSLPKKYTSVCFADLALTGKESFQNAIGNSLVMDTLMSGSANLIVFNDDEIERTLFVEGIVVPEDQGYMCIKNNGKIKISLEGITNDRVSVTRG